MWVGGSVGSACTMTIKEGLRGPETESHVECGQRHICFSHAGLRRFGPIFFRAGGGGW